MKWNSVQDERRRSLLLVNLAAILERADEALLPSIYREIGLSLHASPLQLGSLTFVRSLTQSLCFPLASYLAVHHNRANVIAFGALLWAVATFFVGISTSYVEVAVSRALNGVGLAVVIPAIQSLLADSTEDHNRGTAFGWLSVTSNVGSIVGGALAILLADTPVFGVAGWRISFHVVAILSILVGYLIHKFGVDPRMYARIAETEEKGMVLLWLDLKEMLKDARLVIGVRTFQIIVAQGVAGSFAWGAFAFAPMWLELVGFSHRMTAGLLGVWTVTSSCGSLFGGMLGDYLSIRLPNTGRIVLSQISSGLGVPLSGILLLGLPADPSTWFSHGLVLAIMAFFISWNAAATNNPIFAEIVPEKARTSIYALDRSFESLLAAFAPVLVGYLAQTFFGYVASPAGADFQQEVAMDRKNAISLAHALYATFGIPLTICCLIYSLTYWTYPQDRDRARMQSQLDHGAGHFRLEAMTSKDDVELPAEPVEAEDSLTLNQEKLPNETSLMIPKGGDL